MAGAACLRPADYCRNDGRAIQRWDCFAGSASATTTQHTARGRPTPQRPAMPFRRPRHPPAVRPDPVLDAADPRSNGSALSHTASGVFSLNHVARQVTAGLLAPWRFAAGVSGNGSVEEVVASCPCPSLFSKKRKNPGPRGNHGSHVRALLTGSLPPSGVRDALAAVGCDPARFSWVSCRKGHEKFPLPWTSASYLDLPSVLAWRGAVGAPIHAPAQAGLAVRDVSCPQRNLRKGMAAGTHWISILR